MIRPAAAGLCLALLCAPASPQPASDQELFAAYCVGVLNNLVEMAKQLSGAVPELKGMDSDWLANRRRFQDYLVARGVTTQRRAEAAQGAIMALNRGKAEADDCGNAVEGCYARCRQPNRPFDAVTVCAKQCRGEFQVCVRTDRCSQEERLPF